MNLSTFGVVLSVIAGLGGLTGIAALFYVIPTYRKLQAEARKAGAEASEAVARSATVLLVPLEGRIAVLQSQVEALEKTLALERRTSQEERQVSQRTINGLRDELLQKDRRIIEFEQHLLICGSFATKEGEG